jgi:guanosine-3',5'-bis(diphosphate) 3'-pyrophosphohydrolase
MARKSTVARGVERKARTGQRPAWQDAAAFAAHAHRHQIRKDDRTPYVSHVFRVAMTVRDLFGCEDQTVLTAALLHDTIEDTTTDYEDLEERFGREVADIVSFLTKNMAMPEEEREEEYDARLAMADWRARLIKLADVYDNYCDVKNWPTAKQGRDKAAKARDKCERALALAAADRGRAEVDRAVRLVRALIAR